MDFSKEGIETIQIKVNHSSFDVFVKGLDPDIVMFDRFTAEEQFGWRVAEQAPNALRILDTEDLHSLRKTRGEALKQNVDFTTDLWLENDITKREMASIYRCDLSLIISSFEMKLLAQAIGIHESMLLHLPFMLNPLDDSIISNWPTFETRQDFVFIGFGGHAPNVDAVHYLKTEIWPLIRKDLPKAKLHAYGGNLPQRIRQLHNEKEGFLIHGWTSDVRKVMADARMLLAPLRFGAGLKGKLVDAMLSGTPSITTPIGAEGIHEPLEWNGKICNDPESFAKAAITFYNDQIEWHLAQQNGHKIINRFFDKKGLSENFRQKLKVTQESLAAHRGKNFIGSLLRHQTLASRKYMAKWIEEKNKG